MELQSRTSFSYPDVDAPVGPGHTILGNKLDNPFSKENMEEAFELLNGYSQNLPITHYYVKLLPTTGQHVMNIQELEETKGYEFELQPIHYEVVYQGEEDYIDPSIPVDGGFGPEYGAITKDDYVAGVLSGIPHLVLEEMVIPHYETRLTFTAFVISGNEKYYDAISGFCHPDCPAWPQCLDDDALTCKPSGVSFDEISTLNPTFDGDRSNFPTYILDAGLGNNGEYRVPDPCDFREYMSEMEYLTCMYTQFCRVEWRPHPQVEGGCVQTCICPTEDEEDDDVDLFPETCGCQTFGDRRKPGGSITVEDTQLGLEPVRRVKVKATRRHWGFIWTNTETDDNGCWRIDKRYPRRAKFKAVFRDPVSDRLIIRCVRRFRIWNSFLKPVKHTWYQRKDDRRWNDLCLEINWTDDRDSQQEESHVAATHNNALHEYYDDHLDLPTVDSRLRYLIQTWNPSTGSAPMFNSMGFPGYTLADFDNFLLSFSIVATGSATAIIWELAKPDIIVPMGLTQRSDRIKRLGYHELSHSSQFAQLGEDWWKAYIDLILNVPDGMPFPYGDGTLPGSGRAEIAEGMAEVIGLYMGDLQYGLEHSNGGDAIFRRDINRAERRLFWTDQLLDDMGNQEFPDLDFIPEGMFFDLFDENGAFPMGLTAFEPIGISDQVSNFSFEQMMGALDPGDDEILDYLGTLWIQSGAASGNQPADYTALMQSYGY